MEKRKLAKIPREEASDEMVRFAERAAGTHIVTTKDIEKDLLMVTFYPIRKLKKGKKDAQLRTFFSKNDYISQDLTVEKVKWLTAAFDRMECIHLYEYHWDRDKGNRYTPNMFFWTDADIDRMRSFFKEWSTEKDVKDWTAVERFQDMVRQKRLDEKHAKETNPIDAVMETVKESGGEANILRICGGGAKSYTWSQIKASMLNIPVYLLDEASGDVPVGDALIVGYKVGVFEDLSKAVEQLIKVNDIVRPKEDWSRVYDQLYPYYVNMYQSLKDNLKSLKETMEYIY